MPAILWCQARIAVATVRASAARLAAPMTDLVWFSPPASFALGIEFVSLYEGVDTSTPDGRLVFGIFASIAEFERELIRDRVRSGLATAQVKGTRLRAEGQSWAVIHELLGLGEGTVRRAFLMPAKNLPAPAPASACAE